MQLAQAAADAAQARNSLLIGYGDPALAKMLLGQPSANAAAANPFSTLKNLDYQGGLQRDDLEEGLNRGNVWYGSAHAAKLAQLDRSPAGPEGRGVGAGAVRAGPDRPPAARRPVPGPDEPGRPRSPSEGERRRRRRAAAASPASTRRRRCPSELYPELYPGRR